MGMVKNFRAWLNRSRGVKATIAIIFAYFISIFIYAMMTRNVCFDKHLPKEAKEYCVENNYQSPW